MRALEAVANHHNRTMPSSRLECVSEMVAAAANIPSFEDSRKACHNETMTDALILACAPAICVDWTAGTLRGCGVVGRSPTT